MKRLTDILSEKIKRILVVRKGRKVWKYKTDQPHHRIAFKGGKPHEVITTGGDEKKMARSAKKSARKGKHSKKFAHIQLSRSLRRKGVKTNIKKLDDPNVLEPTSESMERLQNLIIEAVNRPVKGAYRFNLVEHSPVYEAYKVPMLIRSKEKKLNPKTNRVKTFKHVQYVETDIPPEKRTFKNMPKYADGKLKVSFREWLLIKAEDGHNYGKSEADGGWYGWSHRAVYGFKEGDKVEGASCGKKVVYGKYTQKDIDEIERQCKATKTRQLAPAVGTINYENATYEKDFVIRSEAHAKQVAMTFADNVS